LSHSCDKCKIIEESKEFIRELYLKYFDLVSFRYIDDTYEFLAYGFDGVPVLILPGYRPFEFISPSFLMDEDYLIQMINGTLLPDDVIHDKAIERREKGITFNINLEKLLGR